jgi:hypothetical protein
MAETDTAGYENGVLRPLRPLKLGEHQTARLQTTPGLLIEDEEDAAIGNNGGFVRVRVVKPEMSANMMVTSLRSPFSAGSRASARSSLRAAAIMASMTASLRVSRCASREAITSSS